VIRITSTIALDWPQLDFELVAGANDFDDLEHISPAVRAKLQGFIRSGHVQAFDLASTPPTDITAQLTDRAP
jgi:hypothetical protein